MSWSQQPTVSMQNRTSQSRNSSLRILGIKDEPQRKLPIPTRTLSSNLTTQVNAEKLTTEKMQAMSPKMEFDKIKKPIKKVKLVPKQHQQNGGNKTQVFVHHHHYYYPFPTYFDQN